VANSVASIIDNSKIPALPNNMSIIEEDYLPPWDEEKDNWNAEDVQ
jgi:hypothetical protein